MRISRKNTRLPISYKLFPGFTSYAALPLALSEGKKMHGFHVGQDPDDQPSSSYDLFMGDASSDLLRNINDHISSPSTGM